MSPSLKTVDGSSISRIALGASGLGSSASSAPGGEEALVSFFRQAVEEGVNVFDTAELYGGGYSESLLGKAFKGRRRESVFISSKFNPGNASRSGVRKAVEGSLKRLDCDYIDLYQLHWPNPFVPFEETWEALSALLAEGKILHAGVSNCSLQELELFWRVSGGRISAVECCFNASEGSGTGGLLRFCEAQGVLLLAYSPLGQGLINPKDGDSAIEMDALCSLKGCSRQQLLLAWVLAHEGAVPVVRTKSAAHLRDNVKAVSLRLSHEELSLVASAYASGCETVPLERVLVEPVDQRPLYFSEDEALANRFDWIPSPSLLAERVRRGSSPLPLRLVMESDGSYRLSPYDFQGEMKKYWAFRLLYGAGAEVPACIVERKREA